MEVFNRKLKTGLRGEYNYRYRCGGTGSRALRVKEILERNCVVSSLSILSPSKISSILSGTFLFWKWEEMMQQDDNEGVIREIKGVPELYSITEIAEKERFKR